MTEEEFLRISGFIKQRYGIDMTGKKEIVRAGGWHNFLDYMNAVENDKSGVQEKMLVNLITTNYTYFMREFEHFNFLRKVVLPWAKMKESRTRDLRIWCGAASTGEEPYMISMVVYKGSCHGCVYQSAAAGYGGSVPCGAA